jgi:hypothetical protein
MDQGGEPTPTPDQRVAALQAVEGTRALDTMRKTMTVGETRDITREAETRKATGLVQDQGTKSTTEGAGQTPRAALSKLTPKEPTPKKRESFRGLLPTTDTTTGPKKESASFVGSSGTGNSQKLS